MSRPFAFSLIVALAACAAKGADGYFVLENSTPPTGGMCTFTGDPAQPALSQGFVNTASPGYFMAPLLQSRLAVEMGQSPFYKTITVQGARVDLSGAVTAAYQVLAAEDLAPLGTANVPITLIPASIITGLAGRAGGDGVVIEATISFYGQVGGSEIDATPFVYGVTVGDNAVIVNHGSCPATGLTVRTGNACNPLQDGLVDCCCNSFCSNMPSKVCNSAPDCGGGTCSISGKACVVATDCVAGTDGVCTFPNTCSPGQCTNGTNGLQCPARTQ